MVEIQALMEVGTLSTEACLCLQISVSAELVNSVSPTKGVDRIPISKLFLSSKSKARDGARR
jgi:hypothetical protein